MKKKSRSFVVLLGLSAQTALAGIPIETSKVLTFNVSNKGLTRISIENDRIREMYAYPASAKIQLHGSGHVFIAPLEGEEAVFVSIVTSSNKTQDMTLRFKDKKPEPIVLKVSKQERIPKVQVSRWMEAALAEDLPLSFRPQSLREEPRYTQYAVAREKARFLGHGHVISIWEVTLRGQAPHVLNPKDFLNPNEAGKFSRTEHPLSKTTRLVTIRNAKGENNA